jgi:hypothetical protein
MTTPPDFSALQQAFARQHAQFARIKNILAGLEPDLSIDLPDEALANFADRTEWAPMPPSPPPTGLRA